MTDDGWTGIIHKGRNLIRCEKHGEQPLVQAVGCEECGGQDCSECVREVREEIEQWKKDHSSRFRTFVRSLMTW